MNTRNKLKKIIAICVVIPFLIVLFFLILGNNKPQKTAGYNKYNRRLLFSSEDYKESSFSPGRDSLTLRPVSKQMDNCLFLMVSRIDNCMYNTIYQLDTNKEKLISYNTELASLISGATRVCQYENNLICLYAAEPKITYLNLEANIVVAEKDLIIPFCESSQFSINTILDFQCDNQFIYFSWFSNFTYYILVFDYNLEYVDSKSFEEEPILCVQNGQCTIINNKNTLMYDKLSGFKNAKYSPCNIFPKSVESNNIKIYPGNEKYDYFFQLPDYDYLKEKEKKYAGILMGVSGQKTEMIFSLKQMGFNSELITCILPDEDGSFLIGQFNQLSGFEDYYLLKESNAIMDYSPDKNKEKAIIGGLFESPSLYRMINAYNASSDKYYIEYYVYKNGDYADSLRQFNIDVTAEKKLDAITLHGLNKRNLVEKKALVNLDKYIQESEVLSEDSFMPFVYKSMLEDDDKSIYTIYPEMRFEGIISSNNKSVFSAIADGENSYITFPSNEEPKDQLITLLRYSGNRFIDIPNQTVSLDADFIDVIEIIKSNYTQSPTYSDINATKMIKEKKAAFKYSYIDFPYSYFYLKFLFENKPYCTNLCANAPILIPEDEIGILNSSNKKEILYDFLDFMFTDSNYHIYYGNMKFPTLKESWNDWQQRLESNHDYVNRFEEHITVRDYYYNENDVIAYIGPVSSEEISEMNSFFSNSVYVEPIPDRYLKIIYEEVQYYFNDSCSAEEVCRKAEERLKIALLE